METNPINMPEKGFYYHYKHDPNGPINQYAYEVMGVAIHTEEETSVVIYRPLYQNKFLGSADFFARPLEMFMDTVEKDGKKYKRFQKITDTNLISQILAISLSESK